MSLPREGLGGKGAGPRADDTGRGAMACEIAPRGSHRDRSRL